MIHMGAIVGAGLSQGHSTTLGIDSGLFRRFQVGGLPGAGVQWSRNLLELMMWCHALIAWH